MAITNITAGQKDWAGTVNTNFSTLKDATNVTHGDLADVATLLNGATYAGGGGSYSLVKLDQVNRIAILSFSVAINGQKGTNVASYGQFVAFKFNSSLFKSLASNAPGIGTYVFNGWGSTDMLTFLDGYNVGFTNNNGAEYGFGGGANLAGQFLVNY